MGRMMDATLYWFLAGAVSIFVLALILAGLNESRLRRRERALGTRRKTKLRL